METTNQKTNNTHQAIKILKEEREYYLAANRIVERRIRKINKRIKGMEKPGQR
jgi:hypothetical protein